MCAINGMTFRALSRLFYLFMIHLTTLSGTADYRTMNVRVISEFELKWTWNETVLG